mmetsp:Transcript_96543/g.278670  ORF Transcript_96543/g.278670 Transcript_96543/m.278670 type:complete len:505 (-) Transcript_96543:160-1674(-)
MVAATPMRAAVLCLLLDVSRGRRAQPPPATSALLDATNGAAFTPSGHSLEPLGALSRAQAAAPQPPIVLPPPLAMPMAPPPTPSRAWPPLGVARRTDPFDSTEEDLEQPPDDPIENGAPQTPRQQVRQGDGHRMWLHPLDEVAHPLRTGSDAAHTAAHPDLMEISVRGDYGGVSGWHDIVLPREWVGKFELSSIFVTDAEHGKRPYYSGYAQLASAPSRVAAFTALPTTAPGTAREIAMSKLLGTTGIAPEFLDVKEYPDVTFSLMESPGADALSEIIDERESDLSMPVLSINELVKLMTNLLQSLKVFEKVGIVHGALTEDNIFVMKDGAHALITDFHTACVTSSARSDLGCSVEIDDLPCSAFRQAPEMEDEHPNGVSNNVWQMGLVFARMLFGGEDPASSQVKHSFPFETFDDHSADGRRRIREFVRDAFSVKRVHKYDALSVEYKDLLDIIEGMLEKDPEKRLSATAALDAMMEVAKRRKVLVPLPMERSALSEEWSVAW